MYLMQQCPTTEAEHRPSTERGAVIDNLKYEKMVARWEEFTVPAGQTRRRREKW